MTKKEFLAAIEQRLCGLSPSDIEKSLEYYKEMVDDYIENGKTEEEAVAAMGSVDEIVSQILMEMPLPKIVKAKAKSTRGLRAWEIVLLVLGSPIWASLLLAAVIVVFAVYIVIWSAVVVLYAVDFSLAAVSLAGIFISAICAFSGGGVQVLFYVGLALFCAGAAILCFFAFNKITVGIVKASAAVLRGIKHIFIRKAETK
ncbi:MAG: DUF1700 domain-containing protein [Clostridia bacterium]|nr:DUF1700 domain-containing protein [Clostridia bacterium]